MTTAAPPVVQDTSRDHTADIAAITALIKDVETGFNTNDPELLVRPFLANGSVVNVMGVQLTGIDAMLAASRSGLAGALADQYAEYALADITFVRPDVAIAHKHAWATTADGTRLDVGHTMIALYVFVKHDGAWWAAARQNTLVAGG
jgi:uncharacterized protein (TIGR02246 family)